MLSRSVLRGVLRPVAAARGQALCQVRHSSSVLVEADAVDGVPTGVHIITLNRPEKVSLAHDCAPTHAQRPCTHAQRPCTHASTPDTRHTRALRSSTR